MEIKQEHLIRGILLFAVLSLFMLRGLGSISSDLSECGVGILIILFSVLLLPKSHRRSRLFGIFLGIVSLILGLIGICFVKN